jgi:hypothetical protein
MARRPATFRQQDITRALRAARAAGLEVTGYEIEATTGKIIVNTSKETKPTPVTDLDQWIAERARKTQGPKPRS